MSKDKLYPLAMKPGIKRDGTKFQGEYCTAGQWVRFQRGTPRKIGGLQAVNIVISINKIVNFLFLLQRSSTNIWAYICSSKGIFYFQFNDKLTTTQDGPIRLTANLNKPHVLWQTINIIKSTEIAQVNQASVTTKESIIIFFACDNLDDIENTTPGEFYSTIPFTVDLNNPSDTIKIIQTTPGVYNPSNPYNNTNIGNIDGGMCYVAPYLFMYGSNGKVIISNGSNNLNFNVVADNPITTAPKPLIISNDKVIYGTGIRGSTTVTVLFWTLSMVVRVTNVNTIANGEPSFQVSTLTENSSILSSRCVLEYDGLFFWPGSTKRFFTYNGAVQEMANTMSLNYFFDNVDMNKRQLVFGVVKAQYGELWWYYPEIVNSNNPNIGCTHVLIYNIRENSWYDTEHSADSGFVLNSNGGFYTISPSMTQPQPPERFYLFQHEMQNPNEIVPVPLQGNVVFRRVVSEEASSNRLDTDDGLGGGIADNAFDGDLATSCVQTVLNGNIQCTYDNTGTDAIKKVGIRTLIQTRYNIVIEAFRANIWVEVAKVKNQKFNPNAIFWIDIVNTVISNSYRIRQINAEEGITPPLAITEIYLDYPAPGNTDSLDTPISSYFTTPIFSFSSFSPLKEMDGINKWLMLKRIEPDFVMPDRDEIITIQVNTKQFAQDEFISKIIPGPLTIPSDITTRGDITGRTSKIDFYIQGRQMSITISSFAAFELGHILLLINVGDGR